MLARGEDIVPIPGTRNIKRLEENLASTRVKLTDGDLDRLDAVLPPGAASGTRYPEAAMKALNR